MSLHRGPKSGKKNPRPPAGWPAIRVGIKTTSRCSDDSLLTTLSSVYEVNWQSELSAIVNDKRYGGCRLLAV